MEKITKVLYLENDIETDNLLYSAKYVLRALYKDDKFKPSRKTVINDFYILPEDKQLELIRDHKEYIITFYSMFTNSHANSLGQLMDVLDMFKNEQLTGYTFLDSTSCIELYGALKDQSKKFRKQYIDVFKNNTILVHTEFDVEYDYNIGRIVPNSTNTDIEIVEFDFFNQ